MKNLSDKDIVKIIHDVKDGLKSLQEIVTGFRDIFRLFKK